MKNCFLAIVRLISKFRLNDRFLVITKKIAFGHYSFSINISKDITFKSLKKNGKKTLFCDNYEEIAITCLIFIFSPKGCYFEISLKNGFYSHNQHFEKNIVFCPYFRKYKQKKKNVTLMTLKKLIFAYTSENINI